MTPTDFHAPTPQAAEQLPGLIEDFRKNYADARGSFNPSNS
jgi:hypothetical protein